VHVEVVYALPEVQHRVHLELAGGADVATALAAVSRIEPFRSLPLDEMTLAVYGRIVGRDHRLDHGDRVELLRPLLMDPKEARRRRAAQA
jgi:uncharacterized protein